jgi:molecular chaperone GrpE
VLEESRVTPKKIHPKGEAPPAEDSRAEDATPQGQETAPASQPDTPGAGAAAVGAGADGLTALLEEAQNRADEYLDSLQRERAAFQNYRKRVERERAELSQSIAGDLLFRLLPTLDDFYRAIDAVPQGERDQWFAGVALILRKLERFLADEGVVEIEALGQPFDPAFHEVIGMDADAGAESGTITQVLQRGYSLGERVLRPALVRVAP